jgi:predicted house-cleaning noncanonical NTP pyrophosphatase (MazG superfamily)
MDLKDAISNIKSADHYLIQEGVACDEYIDGLSVVIEKLRCEISDAKLKKVLRQKLQTDHCDFSEDQFLQSVCELTVMSDYMNSSDCHFVYEPQISPPKDVDFSVTVNRVRYNVEVKCPSYKEVARKDGEVVVTFANRAPTIDQKKEIYNEIAQRLGDHAISIVEDKNLDNTLKDFLYSAQEKVLKASLRDVNLLVVCCKDEVDMQLWRGYLFGFNGYFTETSFIPRRNFNRVDYVLLTNIQNRHYRYFSGSRIDDRWRLACSFNLLYPNKFSVRNMAMYSGEKDLEAINKVFPNHNIDFESYLKDKGDVPTNESQEAKKLNLGVAFYTDKLKQQGRIFFSKQVIERGVE